MSAVTFDTPPEKRALIGEYGATVVGGGEWFEGDARPVESWCVRTDVAEFDAKL